MQEVEADKNTKALTASISTSLDQSKAVVSQGGSGIAEGGKVGENEGGEEGGKEEGGRGEKEGGADGERHDEERDAQGGSKETLASAQVGKD